MIKLTLRADTADPLELRRLAEREAAWAQRSQELNGQTHAYEAAARPKPR